LYLGLLECERSAQEYRTAIALGAKDESTFRGAAMLYGLPEDVVTLEEAIEWLEAAAGIAPEDPNIWGRLGQICHQAGRESEALAYWSKALLCPHPLEQGYLSVIERATGISSST
jgi:tetratricopeptide (TPR) repeat protein